MSLPYAYVTVGTTKFEALVESVCSESSARALLEHFKLRRVLVQMGAGAYPSGMEASAATGSSESKASSATASESHHVVERHGIRYEFYRLKPSTAEDIAGASLVISHAGAGSIFDCLRCPLPEATARTRKRREERESGRPLLVVINDSLADNHQVELAEAMAERGHCLYCIPPDLPTSIERLKAAKLHALPPRSTHLFEAALSRLIDEDR